MRRPDVEVTGAPTWRRTRPLLCRLGLHHWSLGGMYGLRHCRRRGCGACK